MRAREATRTDSYIHRKAFEYVLQRLARDLLVPEDGSGPHLVSGPQRRCGYSVVVHAGNRTGRELLRLPAVEAIDSSREAHRDEMAMPSPYGTVPTISRFLGIKIGMFFDDHGFPHFHAYHADGEAKIRIDSLEIIESSLERRQLRFVLAWAELHQAELEENWHRARANETLKKIEPLR